MNIKEWRKEINKHFPGLVLPAEIGLSVICQLCIKDITNPFGLVYVDVPSSGKTITLNFFTGLTEIVHATDSFTPASFVSNAANRRTEDLEKIDLLPRIKNKVFLVRDLAPILGMRDDDLLKTMGVLTRVFDGEGLTTDSGLYGQRGYRGKYLFMFLAASTPISPRVWKVMGNFGSRLFFYNLNMPDKDHFTLARQLNAKLSPKKKERRCRRITEKLVREIFDKRVIYWDREKDKQDLLEEIAIIAQLMACLRGIIKVWKGGTDDEVFDYTAPQIEKADRINQALYNLARGHAVACGRTTINEEDIAIVIKVALSSAPIERVEFFKLLLSKGGELNTEDIIDELGFSRPTALKLMTKFHHLKIIETKRPLDKLVGRPEQTVKIAGQFSWFVGPRFKELDKLLQRHI